MRLAWLVVGGIVVIVVVVVAVVAGLRTPEPGSPPSTPAVSTSEED
jgi:hypothetical protein